MMQGGSGARADAEPSDVLRSHPFVDGGPPVREQRHRWTIQLLRLITMPVLWYMRVCEHELASSPPMLCRGRRAAEREQQPPLAFGGSAVAGKERPSPHVVRIAVSVA
jgi:hypothetical protein